MNKWICWIFGHSWDEPFHKENIKFLFDFVFFSYGTQKGKRKCRRCSHIENCTRSGIMSMFGEGEADIWSTDNEV